ncbi:energy-converting NiFe hydrogenase A subunit EhaA [Methanobrevibacter sp.]|uniref:energy-converting NiFe hydrogenase A subunit EhaA n=1 Tax=Methanobrevibacter sp. TaxID=66852 RepID=UPI0025E57F4A|nr:energy-converting NiFe hydrogenase A subunit EhaA [Methanobrevibacter sp.]MBQ2961490.1 energy-converting hydrogenase A subunit A EhaA [Methanobrevibacter sp.]
MISIGANGFQYFVNYIVAILVAIALALALRLPLLPENPIRFSWTKSALFPTPVFAIGILAIFYSLNVFWIYDGIVIAILTGIFSALFVKYLFDYIFPSPQGGAE